MFRFNHMGNRGHKWTQQLGRERKNTELMSFYYPSACITASDLMLKLLQGSNCDV